MVNGAYIRVALSNNSDFMCFQKIPCGLYLGQCLVTFSLNLEVLYVAIMFYRSVWTPVLGELLYTEQELGNSEDRYAAHVSVKVVDYRRTCTL